jgi:hypothetical protein
MASKTKIIGRINFDSAALENDLAALASIPIIKEQYDEFSAGTWINHSIYNRTGEWSDTRYSDFEHPALKTHIGEQTPYLCRIIEDTFDVQKMRMARVRNLVDGIVIPHIDFLELDDNKDRYIRILIALETCLDSYHSEEKFGTFRMRKGEIWILESQVPHGAYNLGPDNRRILSLDFQYSDEAQPHHSRIFKDKSAHVESIVPAMVQRSELAAEDREDYLRMLATQLKGRYDAEKIVVKLTHMQMRYESPVSEIYDNLVAVAKLTGDAALVAYCEDLRRFYVGARVMDERFDLRPELVVT